MIKECKRCGENKSLSDFYVDNTKKNKISSYCKSCVNKKQRDYYKKKKGSFKLKVKKCSVCGISKQTIDFHKKSNGRYGVGNMCKTCTKVWMKKYHSKPEIKEKIAERDAKKFICNISSLEEKDFARRKRKSHFLKTTYGISIEEFEYMLVSQKFRCAICGKEFSDKLYSCHKNKADDTPYVDHNHNTGKVRSLLCSSCNSGLGSFKEDEKILKRAIKYIRRYNA